MACLWVDRSIHGQCWKKHWNRWGWKITIKKAPGHHLIKNAASSGHFLPQRLQGITSSTSRMGSRLGTPRKCLNLLCQILLKDLCIPARLQVSLSYPPHKGSSCFDKRQSCDMLGYPLSGSTRLKPWGNIQQQGLLGLHPDTEYYNGARPCSISCG